MTRSEIDFKLIKCIAQNRGLDLFDYQIEFIVELLNKYGYRYIDDAALQEKVELKGEDGTPSLIQIPSEYLDQIKLEE